CCKSPLALLDYNHRSVVSAGPGKAREQGIPGTTREPTAFFHGEWNEAFDRSERPFRGGLLRLRSSWCLVPGSSLRMPGCKCGAKDMEKRRNHENVYPTG